MSQNFNINPNFNNFKIDNNFNQFLNDFNKVNLNPNGSQSDFEKVFNSINTNSAQPVQAGIQYNNYIGIDAINAQKIEMSDTAKMAHDFGKSLSDSLNGLNDIQRQAESDMETFASGGDISVHDVMISAQKSSLAMQMAIQLRNQVINAYNEFKNMSI